MIEMVVKTKLNSFIKWIKKSVWAFPVFLFIVLVLLTALKISGSSIGVYYKSFYGSSQKDPNLIYGQPKPIRSDEWLGSTQLLISQYKNGFPRVNPDISRGQDLSLVVEAPTKDWPTIFKPHLWIYFALPLEFAFAFRWWLVMFLLVVSCYFFILHFLPDKKLFAIIFSAAIGISPFELWWYQSGAFLTVAYGLFIIITALRIIDNSVFPFIKNKLLNDSILVLLLAFLMVSFGLILYPPFQIPIAIVIVFFMLGYLLHKKINERVSFRGMLGRVSLLAISATLAALIGSIFIVTHRMPIDKLNNSVYPGHRIVESGMLKPLYVFDGFVMPILQSGFRGGHFLDNQSEASNFILLLPFFLIPGLALLVREWRKDRRIDWVLLAIIVCALLFFIRIFTGIGNDLFKFLLLNRVPHKRLIIGLGFLNILLVVFIVKKISSAGIKKKKLLTMATIYGFICFLVLLVIGRFITIHYPLFLHSMLIIFVLASFFALIIVTFLVDMPVLAAILFLLFSLFSTFRILPLYRGLSILTDNKVVHGMEKVSSRQDTWAIVGADSLAYENFGLLAGRSSLSIQFYPNLPLWEQVGGRKYENIYNREGHAIFSDNPALTAPIVINSTDSFFIRFVCSKFILNNINFALSVHPLNISCVKLVDTISYPQTKFYLYKVTE